MRISRSCFLIFFCVTAGGAFADLAVGSEATELLQRGLEALRKDGPADAESLLRASTREARSNGERETFARGSNALGIALRRQGRYLEAETVFVGALTTLERLGPGREAEIAAAYANLGLARLSLGKLDRAGEALDRAVGMLVEMGDDAGAAAALTSLGARHHARRDWASAEATFLRAIELYRAAGRAGPEIALCHNGLGVAAFEAGHFREAVRQFQTALEEYGSGPGRAKTLANLGRVTLALGDAERARGILEGALVLQEASLGREHPEVAVTLEYLAAVATVQGETRRSAELADRGKEIRMREYETNGGGATVDASAWAPRER